MRSWVARSRIRGTTDAPVVERQLRPAARAPSRWAAVKLTFTQGTVTFNGEGLKKKIDPTLDFVAQTQVVDVTATVKITGLADAAENRAQQHTRTAAG